MPINTIRRTTLMVAVVVGLANGSSTPAHAYQLAEKWTSTASGATGALGSAITLTWSIAPDGTVVGGTLGSSEFVTFMDSHFGGGIGDYRNRTWFGHLQASFDRWSALSGITYVYEPEDDGVSIGTFPGSIGVRGDIRIGGTFIDGRDGILGFSSLPNNGDIVLDTGDALRYTDPEQNYIGLRSVMVHEHGHGLGFQHVLSSDADFAMERFTGTSYDGPQLDDIRAVHRAYGDSLEKTNDEQGNDNASNATPFGLLAPDTFYSVGESGASGTAIEPDKIDFVSIDDNSDFDFFSFDVAVPSRVSLAAEPLGPTYLEGADGGSESPLDSAKVSDLTLTLFGSNGTSFLATSNTAGLGVAESINDFELSAPGRYFARVSGDANDVQLYRFSVSATPVPEPVHRLCYVLWIVALTSRRARYRLPRR